MVEHRGRYGSASSCILGRTWGPRYDRAAAREGPDSQHARSGETGTPSCGAFTGVSRCHGTAVRSLEAQGNDATRLKDAILSDRRFFAIQEATLDGQNIDPANLHRVVTREVKAGRMEPDSFSDLAKSGAAVLGSAVSPPVKKGFFQRLFGSSAGE